MTLSIFLLCHFTSPPFYAVINLSILTSLPLYAVTNPLFYDVTNLGRITFSFRILWDLRSLPRLLFLQGGLLQQRAIVRDGEVFKQGHAVCGVLKQL